MRESLWVIRGHLSGLSALPRNPIEAETSSDHHRELRSHRRSAALATDVAVRAEGHLRPDAVPGKGQSQIDQGCSAGQPRLATLRITRWKDMWGSIWSSIRVDLSAKAHG
jgi:hypothetical protein